MEILKNITIGQMLEDTVKRYPGHRAVEYLGQTWDYAQLDQVTDEIAMGFLALGMNKGTKTGIWANDCPNTLFSLLALLKIGAVAVMLNTSWNPKEVKQRLIDADVEYLLYDDGFKEIDFVAFTKELDLPLLREKIYIGGGDLAERLNACSKEYQTENEEIDLAELLHKSKTAVQPEDEDMILFTSGSTSAPKGVVTTHYSRANIGFAQAEMLGANEQDVFCVALPMFHCFCMGGNIMGALAVGACLSFPENRRTEKICQAVERAQCTILTAVPTLYSALLASKSRAKYDLSSLRIGLVGGAGCSSDLFKRVCGEMGMELLPSLGQTEATAAITAGRLEDETGFRATNAGYVISHVEAKIVDIATGKALACGESGELCIRGYNVMKEYYKQPEQTAKTIDEDGFLHTGDMGYLDEDGRLYLTGRLKELIIRGGENIAPGELEQVIGVDRRIDMVKVVGVPDTHYGEEVCACVVPKPGEKILEEEVRHLVAEQLASYKVPRYVLFLEAMPLMGNGKIDVLTLKEQVSGGITK